MKRISLLWTIFVLILTNTFLKAQMSGAYSVPSTFTSIAAAINSLNAVGVSAAGFLKQPGDLQEKRNRC